MAHEEAVEERRSRPRKSDQERGFASVRLIARRRPTAHPFLGGDGGAIVDEIAERLRAMGDDFAREVRVFVHLLKSTERLCAISQPFLDASNQFRPRPPIEHLRGRVGETERFIEIASTVGQSRAK